MMALWKARGGSLNKEESLNKEVDLFNHGIVEGKGGKV